MATSTFVNPWHPDAIPPIDPSDPRIVHPTGEFGPESYIDTGAYSPAKYPRVEASKQGGGGDSKKKKWPNLKLDLSKKEGRTQTTLTVGYSNPRHPRVYD